MAKVDLPKSYHQLSELIEAFVEQNKSFQKQIRSDLDRVRKGHKLDWTDLDCWPEADKMLFQIKELFYYFSKSKTKFLAIERGSALMQLLVIYVSKASSAKFEDINKKIIKNIFADISQTNRTTHIAYVDIMKTFAKDLEYHAKQPRSRGGKMKKDKLSSPRRTINFLCKKFGKPTVSFAFGQVHSELQQLTRIKLANALSSSDEENFIDFEGEDFDDIKSVLTFTIASTGERRQITYRGIKNYISSYKGL